MSAHEFDRRLPCEQFYWAVLKPSPSMRMRRSDRQALSYQFEESLPVPLERVHAAYQKLPDGRVLACAMHTDRLSSLAGAVLSLGPGGIPGHLGVLIEPRSINLLSGEFEPKQLGQARRRTAALTALALAALTTILAVGLERRAAAHRDHHREIMLRSNALMESVVGPTGSDSQPAFVRFSSELRSLRQSNASVRVQQPRDVAALFAKVLAMARVCEIYEPRVESLMAADDSLHLTATLPTSESAQQWIASASSIDDWALEQPQVSAAGGSVRVALRWKPIEPTKEPR